MRRFFLFVGGFLAAVTAASGAEAAFSKDGNTVYCCRNTGLVAVHVEPFSEEALDLSSLIGTSEINAVTLRSSDGVLLIATPTAVWAYHPEKKSADKLLDKPAGSQIKDIAFDPASEGLLVTVYPSDPTVENESRAWWLAKNAKSPRRIFVRRIEFIDGPVFTSKGELFFATEGDIWRGFVEHEDADDAESNREGALVAVRYAPLANRETYGGTPMQIGAREMALSGTKIYAHVARMGGSGWGNMVRLDAPLATDTDSDKAIGEPLKQRLQTYQRALASVEVFDDNGGWCNLCASPDGRRVFYATAGKPYLITDNGQPTLMIPLPNQAEQKSKELVPETKPSPVKP